MSGAADETRSGTWQGVRILPDLAVWAALMGLLGLTLFCAYVPLGWANTPIGLGIAGIKAALVGTLFMGLSRARPLVRLAAAAGFFWIAILFSLTFSDLLTRPWWPS